jgi:GNAT superfamily N-acetyltransferase
MGAEVQVRFADVGDEAAWMGLWSEYCAIFMSHARRHAVEATWNRLFDPGTCLFSLVALCEGKVVGLANGVLVDSTLDDVASCELSDLYVQAAWRRMRVGSALLQAAADAGRGFGCRALQWATAANNLAARALYETTPGHQEASIRYRMVLRQNDID